MSYLAACLSPTFTPPVRLEASLLGMGFDLFLFSLWLIWWFKW